MFNGSISLTCHLVQDNFQSNGACSTSCAGYAFAIVQYKSCWCSDYIPADTASTGSCSVACPGYPYESCGDESSGLFGYVALGKAPLGTKGAASSKSPTPQETSTIQATQPSTQAVSTQSIPGALLDFPHTPPGLVSRSFRSTVPVLRPSLPPPRSPTYKPSIPISFETHFLTSSAQTSSPNPVTVSNTVTAQPSTHVSYVSIV